MLGSADARDLLPQVDAAAPARPSRHADRLVLVRPDGYVGWAGRQADLRSWADAYFRRRPNPSIGDHNVYPIEPVAWQTA